ncbi:hypothetical protein [Anaerosporobacter sp.]
MAKSIAFIGVPSRDIVYYIGRVLRLCGQEVLIVTLLEKEEKDYQPNYYMGLDWITCSKEWLQVHGEILNDYSFVLYELEIQEIELSVDILNSFDNMVVIANLYKRTMDEVAKAIFMYNKQCILIIRDICNKRLDSKYFIRNYPDSKKLCMINELWLDSYDAYYKQCLEFEEVKDFKRMSNDMMQTLSFIIEEIHTFTSKEIHYAINQLKKGVVEC